MHPHLYTKTSRGCEEVMQVLEECHARGFIFRALGGCNQAKRDVNLCLRAARLERMAANREAAKVRTARRREIFKEIDDNP